MDQSSSPYPHHECGVFAVFNHPNAAALTYYGLFALQHRGQESAGIVTAKGNGELFNLHKAMGLVGQVFKGTTSSASPAPAPSGTRVIRPPGRATSSTPSP